MSHTSHGSFHLSSCAGPHNILNSVILMEEKSIHL